MFVHNIKFNQSNLKKNRNAFFNTMFHNIIILYPPPKLLTFRQISLQLHFVFPMRFILLQNFPFVSRFSFKQKTLKKNK